jgi:hypothetical protein
MFLRGWGGGGRGLGVFTACGDGGWVMAEITEYVYMKSTTVYVPSSALGLPQSLACNFDDWRKSLALCLLCGRDVPARRVSQRQVHFQFFITNNVMYVLVMYIIRKNWSMKGTVLQEGYFLRSKSVNQ